MSKLNLQLNLRTFDGEPPATPPATPPAVPPATPAPPAGRTYSEDYVKDLREEAKSHRMTAKQYETRLRTLLGVKEGDITDEHVSAFQTNQTKANADALAKANDRLISAEIRLLEGYNHKLLEKLIDRSKVTVSDTGEVTGLKEAAEELLKEFPELKKTTGGTGGVNPPGGGGETEIQQLEKEYDEAVKKGNRPLQIALKNKIFALRQKKG